MALGFAQDFPWIIGVVGWVLLTDPGIKETLSRYASDPLIVGAREILQLPEVSPLFDDPVFHNGLEALARLRFPYDLLIGPWQLEESIRLADRRPDLAALCSAPTGHPA